MNEALKNVIGSLRAGNQSIAYEYKEYLNDIAITLYNKTELDFDSLEDLRDLLTICNITYNDTDSELLPIEDGVYDLLLEKYKKYDPHFQVGAEVIDFQPSKNNKVYIEKNMKPAISFIDPVSDKDVFFINDIVVPATKYIDHRDFEVVPAPVSPEYITKRKHDTQHNHPELVGTLDKCKFVYDKDAVTRGVYEDSNVKIVERDFFMPHIAAGIINTNQQFDIVLELKYDGISVEADCTDEVVSARSRGDTGVGQASDLTPILKGYKFPHRTPGSPMIGVKFEAIMTQYDLPRFNAAKQYEYKNCRSAIVGLLSSSDAWKYRDFITLVPLAVESDIYHNECHSDRWEEIQYLNKEFVSKGCPLRATFVRGNYLENLTWIKLFTENAESMRHMVPFMYDGIVLSYRDESIRQKLGRENFINKFSVAVKFNPLKKDTVFRGYTYTVGQDGSITPMIHYDPVEFYGTIHSKSSGHSYARFQELALHKGDIISVEYVNDVMPYVSKPIANDFNLENEKYTPLEQFPFTCPICGMQITVSDSGKSAKCTNPDCGGRSLARMVNTCAKLGLDGFGEATIDRLGCYHLKDLVETFSGDDWLKKLIEKGFGPTESLNMANQIDDLMTKPLQDSKLLGSIGFTSISTKTFELILDKVNFAKLREMFNALDPSGYYYNKAVQYMANIKGIGPATADTIGREWKYFSEDLEFMVKNANLITYKPREGKRIIFSGFRDKNLADYLNSIGFICDEGADVKKDTYAVLVNDINFSSSKTQKASKYGIIITTVSEFTENINKYLS